MKHLYIALPVVLFLTWASLAPAAQAPAAPAPLGIGYVSAQRFLNETIEGREANARFQKIQQERTAEIRKKQQTLEATRRELAKTTDVAGRTRLLQEESEQRIDIEREGAVLQQDIQFFQRQFRADILTRVKPILTDIARERNLQLVLNADTTLAWSGDASLDLTADLIDRLNAQTSAAAKP